MAKEKYSKLTHQERVDKWFKDNMWYMKNFHKVDYFFANGFIDYKTYVDLSKLKIRKFNGQLAILDKVIQEHYDKKEMVAN